MADELDQIKKILGGDQSSIKQEYNNATVGLNLDQTLNQIKPGTLTYALNAAVENFDASSINYQNEQGNEFCLQFPDNYVLIGTYFISEKSKHIFFLVNPNVDSYGCQIGYMDNNNCIYYTLVSATCLNFQVNNPIHKVVHRLTNCSTEIYWTDGLNSRRYLDIDNIPWKLVSGTPLCNPVPDIGNLDCNQLKLQPNFDIPQLDVFDITTGGNIIAGTYQFAAQYADASGNAYTSYYSVTNPTPIADIQITSRDFNYPVGKSIIVDVSHLDLTGQFQYFNLAVIKTVNSITSVELVGTYFIEGINRRVTYTGQIVDNIRLSIADIFEKYPYYDVAEDLTTAQDILIWDGLKSNERINYQKIANQVSLLWETYRIPKEENYSDELNATNLRGYLRDEVYAFEIVFELNNGMQTDGFHIPGRASIPSDLNPVYITNPDFIGDPIDTTDYNYRWTVYNTATVLGTATENKIGNASPYQYGTFSYWESKEEYPCEQDLWGELAGTPIRHHKFPDVSVSPIYDTRIFSGVSNMVMGNNAVFPIGVRLDVDQIKSLIASSNLTQDQKDSIVGFKIVRGDRSTNKSIVGKGILRNVGQYTRENQNYYYPNYPYNDINSDPFLNTTNNAWLGLSESFEIKVLKLTVNSVGERPSLKVRYTDPNTNKEETAIYYDLGTYQLCSIGKPIIISEGMTNIIYYNRGSNNPPAQTDATVIVDPANIGTVSYSDFDVYRVFIQGGLQRKFSYGFDDPITGTTQYYNTFTGAGQSWVVRVRKGTLPYCTGGRCENFREQIQTDYTRRVTTCSTQEKLNSFQTPGNNLPYRQIFNSPETSFGQPFVGTGQVLKLENVMFGKGLAHFVKVKNNAKYKLLTEEAQRDALKSSQDVANMTNPFSATAMFAAYQSYLTIYINGITRRNYAYSFNSVADYNYSMAIPNDLGVKQRTLEIAKYLIPGVQSTGIGTDDFPINNYQRESSVYLKTDDFRKDNITSVSALPFPDKSPYIVSGGNSIITERSRFTISENGNCSTPEKEQDIEVVSYYASLKNISVSQWGQIYSYQTIDTGFQEILKDSSGIKVVFGGDTFINRFAFKTKLPFFIDNRVGAPDDSDIFYDEIGNIAYPKYWHSARSVLKDYSVISGAILPGILTNIISYKDHNFDCPNSQLPAPPTNNPGRTFYDGYFYLFAYGIPNFYCESSYNVDLRQAFNNREGDFYPHVSNNIPDDWVQENFVSIANDNTYYYNTTYSKQNKENVFTHLPPDFKDGNLCFTNYPFRAIYSDLQSTDADNRVNNWLIYRALSYFDFPQNYGNLVSLDGIQNKAILARFENKSLMYNNLLTVDTSNPQAAYLGNPNLFRGTPPIDFAETDLGYVGSQNKFFLKIPNGQITIDAKRGQVFLIAGTQAQDMSASGSGMNRFFTDHLAFEILRYFPEVDTDNHFNGVGLHGVFDTKFDRVIITKLDYIPLSNNISYDSTLKEYFIEENNIQTQIYLTDTEYFCNKSWTLSFNFNTKSWTSFHSYIPNFYIGENNFFYSGINGCCDEFDFVAGPLVVGPTTTTTTTVALNCTIVGNARVPNCNLNGTAIEIIPTTTTTTTLTPATTTTTTTALEPNCILINATTDSIVQLSIVYLDCNLIEQSIFIGGISGNSINFCIYDIVSVPDNVTITAIGACTTTTTTTI